MTGLRKVYIVAAHCIHPAGEGVDGLLSQQAPLTTPSEFAPGLKVSPAVPYKLAGRVFDRRLCRGFGPQSLRLLACLERIASRVEGDPLRTALSAALPEIDEPSPGWDVCAAVMASKQQPARALVESMPPLHGLMRLNTSIMTIIAAGLGCRGAMAGFSTQDESSGLDALREGWGQIVDDDADIAVIAAGSPSLLPYRFLRSEKPDLSPLLPPAEGVAALVLSSSPDQAKGALAEICAMVEFQLRDDPTEAVLLRVIDDVLRQADVQAGQVGFAVFDAGLPAQLAASFQLVPSARQRVGSLGPASVLMDIIMLLEMTHPAKPYLLRIGLAEGGRCSAILLRHVSVNETDESI